MSPSSLVGDSRHLPKDRSEYAVIQHCNSGGFMSLFESLVVDRALVEHLLQKSWGLVLGDLIKESQNQTFNALNEATGLKYAVRVSSSHHLERVQDEIFFVNSLVQFSLQGVCGFIPTSDEKFFVVDGNLILVVMRWAEGSLIDFMKMDWLTYSPFIFSWGAYMGRFHNASREFILHNPEVASRIQTWQDVHCGLMKGTAVSTEDQINWPHEDLGLLHGDLNISNFHYKITQETPTSGQLYVFDWDQVQQGYWELDIAQACLAPFMLSEGGSIVNGEPIPQANHPEIFLQHFLEGYQSTCTRSVNVPRLERMLMSRRVFYKTFALRALKEEEEGQTVIPVGMKMFLEYILRWTQKIEC
jgi:Ser/Thr protein kinase RdoA (MazF antagonist)